MTPEDQALAGELALGLLDGEERAQALRRTLSDPDFAREVEWWRAHFATMLAEVRPVPAPQGLIDNIGAPSLPKPRNRLRLVVPAALTAVAAAALFMIPRPTPTVLPPVDRSPAVTLLAALQSSDGAGTPISAIVDRGAGQIRVVATGIAPAGKAAQLWVIRDGVPRSLGLLSDRGTTRLALPVTEREALQAGLVLAISIEPLGGSPQATPTGPVVASGPLTAI
ncbi:anti-sigma factor [uncultured Sphingomonas sp.]|uniref:anti-sigma factor n=1 Tax=uncultured Sphingomonas sp. TaxID=158754 RepID=UPI0025FAAC9C|nr:anti-sigma factor [uncultured Sphingomonas sp.]